MKKTIIFRMVGFIALVAIIGFGMAGCDTGGGSSGNPFTGTVWEGQTEDGSSITVTFTDTTWEADMGGTVVSGGTYTYSGKTATLKVDGMPGQATATINGNKLAVNAEDFDMGVFTLTPKAPAPPNPFGGTRWEGPEGMMITFSDTGWTSVMSDGTITEGTYTFDGGTAILTIDGVDGEITVTISGNTLNVDASEIGWGELDFTKNTAPNNFANTLWGGTFSGSSDRYWLIFLDNVWIMPGANVAGVYDFDGNTATLRSEFFGTDTGTATISRNGNTLTLDLSNMGGGPTGNFTKETVGRNELIGSVSILGVEYFGYVSVGDTLEADIRYLGGSGAVTYKWQFSSETNWDSFTDIPGASGTNKKTYTVSSEYAEKFIRVQVTRAGYTGTLESMWVRVMENKGGPAEIARIEVRPNQVEVEKGSNSQFFAFAYDADDSPVSDYLDLTWSITTPGTASKTDIDDWGYLSVSADETLTRLTVRAALTADSTIFGEATVTITGGGTDPETGSLTITGIPAEYNGKWVVTQGTLGEEPNEIRLAGAGEFDGTTGDGKGVQISGGSVTLNVWEMDENGLSPFTGNGQASFDVYIISSETFNAGDEEEFGKIIAGHGTVTVTFTNGTGSGVFSANDGYTITINGMDSDLNGEPAFVCLHSDIRNIDWDQNNHYGKGGTVEDGSLTVTFQDWDGSGSYQIAVFFWEDQGASMTATYYYTNGAELNNATPLPAYDFDDDDGNTVLNFSDFRNADGSGGGDPATVTSVAVMPETASVAKGGTESFTVKVIGTGSYSHDVTWSIDETGKHTGTTIDADGLLTVAADETETTLTVRATSTMDPHMSGTVTVTITDPNEPLPLTIDNLQGTWTGSGAGMDLTLEFSGDDFTMFVYIEGELQVGTKGTVEIDDDTTMTLTMNQRTEDGSVWTDESPAPQTWDDISVSKVALSTSFGGGIEFTKGQ